MPSGRERENESYRARDKIIKATAHDRNEWKIKKWKKKKQIENDV